MAEVKDPVAIVHGDCGTHREGLVVELAAVDGLAARPGPVGEVAALQHELRERPTHTQTKKKHNANFRS